MGFNKKFYPFMCCLYGWDIETKHSARTSSHIYEQYTSHFTTISSEK